MKNSDPNFESCRSGTRKRWKKIQHLLIEKHKLDRCSVLDIGCAHGDGCEFVPEGVWYLGIDSDEEHISFVDKYWSEYIAASKWRSFCPNDFRKIMHGRHDDTIVVLETLEHIPDGVEWAHRLKEHCDRLIISVPENKEGHGEINNKHVLMNLQAKDFEGFTRLDELCDQYSMFLMWDRNPK